MDSLFLQHTRPRCLSPRIPWSAPWSQSLQGFEIPPLCLRGAEMNLCGSALGNRQMPFPQWLLANRPLQAPTCVAGACSGGTPSARPGELGWGWNHTHSLQAVGSPPPPQTLDVPFKWPSSAPVWTGCLVGPGSPGIKAPRVSLGGYSCSHQAVSWQSSPDPPPPSPPHLRENMQEVVGRGIRPPTPETQLLQPCRVFQAAGHAAPHILSPHTRSHQSPSGSGALKPALSLLP